MEVLTVIELFSIEPLGDSKTLTKGKNYPIATYKANEHQ